jgi:hypothetical protein
MTGILQVWDLLKTLLFWKFDTGTTQVHGQHVPPSTERGVTDSTQEWIGYVSAPLLTWQSQKARSGSNLYPSVSVSVVTWHSWKKRQSRRNLELNSGMKTGMKAYRPLRMRSVNESKGNPEVEVSVSVVTAREYRS